MSVQKKILDIMQTIKTLEKDGKIAFGATKYNFISDEEVTQKVRQEMIVRGLVMYPTKSESEVISNEKGNFLTKVTQTFVIYDTDDDSFIEVQTCGQGMDSADKGSGKSNTNARKYALLQTFMLTGDDPDVTASDSYRTNTPVSNAPASQYPANNNGGGVSSDTVIDFGKKRGQTLGQIFAEDRSYIEWLAGREGKFQQAAIQLLS